MGNSCMSCGGCFTGAGCVSSKSIIKNHADDKARFIALLESAAALTTHHDNHIIPTILSELSKNVFPSQTVLIQAVDELSLMDFLDLARLLYDYGIVGNHIAWAGEYCHGDVNHLHKILGSDDEKEGKLLLCRHCNDQAEMFELFNQLPSGSVGRTSLGD
ncbi:hypothetical protein BDF20DRAFT_835377 [Mycotypha africana]|uniref:uncharacterized protein n=1 Tax=Mycotypha africana TaxID=64632 RepID=UPI0023018A78|nr:uncharacterized protein BDF20DRAFT_835377 [Mycotypha africana]KAI8979339.1 hypothetical protein BDF20DRAFT_835377 [Mycotypha africana]